MKTNITNKENELLKKYYSCGISIEALAMATGINEETIKKILGILKWFYGMM